MHSCQGRSILIISSTTSMKYKTFQQEWEVSIESAVRILSEYCWLCSGVTLHWTSLSLSPTLKSNVRKDQTFFISLTLAFHLTLQHSLSCLSIFWKHEIFDQFTVFFPEHFQTFWDFTIKQGTPCNMLGNILHHFGATLLSPLSDWMICVWCQVKFRQYNSVPAAPTCSHHQVGQHSTVTSQCLTQLR